MYLLYLALGWEEVKNYVLGAGWMTLLLWVLNTIKDWKKDKKGTEKTDSEIKRNEAETEKTTIETANAAVDMSLKLAQKLYDDNASMKNELEKTNKELEIAQKTITNLTDQLLVVQQKFVDLQVKFTEVQYKLNSELQKSVLREVEYQDLKTELNNLKR